MGGGDSHTWYKDLWVIGVLGFYRTRNIIEYPF